MPVDPADPVELRRLAEAAREASGRVPLTREQAEALRAYHEAVRPPVVVLALLDERQALLDRIAGLEAGTLRLDFAPSLVDVIEKALTECVREDGQGFTTTVAALQGPWPEPAHLSNLRTVATWVAMALADQHNEDRRALADPGAVAGEPESEETTR